MRCQGETIKIVLQVAVTGIKYNAHRFIEALANKCSITPNRLQILQVVGAPATSRTLNGSAKLDRFCARVPPTNSLRVLLGCARLNVYLLAKAYLHGLTV